MQDGNFDLSAPEIALGLVTAAVAYFAPPLAFLTGAFFVGLVMYRLDPTPWRSAATRLLPGHSQPLTPPSIPEAPLATPAAAQQPLLPALAQSPCLLVVGSRGSGKTSLLQHLVAQRRGIVLDPHATPGKWGDVRVIGAGGKYQDIDLVLTWLVQSMRGRIQQLGDGTVAEGEHPIMPITIDEWRAIKRNVPGAEERIADLLTEARKVNMDIILSSPTERVKGLGFEGEGDLKEGFDIVRLRRVDGQRVATLDTGSGPQAYALPGVYQQPARSPVAPPAATKTLEGLLHTSMATGMHRGGMATGMATGMEQKPDMDAPKQTAPAHTAHTTVLPDIDAKKPQRKRHIAQPNQKRRRTSGMPDMDAVNGHLSQEDKIRRMLMVPMSANDIAKVLGGDRNKILAKVREIKGGA